MTVLPVKIYIGSQSGRQYALCWRPESERFSFHRVDLMDHIRLLDGIALPDGFEQQVADFCSHAWGVTGNNAHQLDHIEMTVYAGPEETHIPERLEREKRCGSVAHLDETHWRFTADVYHAVEMLPWLRTFTGRVTDLSCTNRLVLTRFWKDFRDTLNLYGGDGHAVP